VGAAGGEGRRRGDVLVTIQDSFLMMRRRSSESLHT
jgi:hypothetical protein